MGSPSTQGKLRPNLSWYICPSLLVDYSSLLLPNYENIAKLTVNGTEALSREKKKPCLFGSILSKRTTSLNFTRHRDVGLINCHRLWRHLNTSLSCEDKKRRKCFLKVHTLLVAKNHFIP